MSATLTSEAAQTLKVALEILQNIWMLIELHEETESNHQLSAWFQQQYAETFADSFLTDGFPYQQSSETGKIISILYFRALIVIIQHLFQIRG